MVEAQKAGDHMAEKFLIKKKAEIFGKGFQLFVGESNKNPRLCRGNQ